MDGMSLAAAKTLEPARRNRGRVSAGLGVGHTALRAHQRGAPWTIPENDDLRRGQAVIVQDDAHSC